MTDPAFPGDALLCGLLEISGPFERSCLTTESRHHIEQIRIAGRSWVVKTYRSGNDRHFDHRFRREEKLLSFLHANAPGLAPRPVAGAIVAGNACLVMEHLGPGARNLQQLLEGGEPPLELARQATALLARLHRLTARFNSLLAAFCQSIVLDRNDRETLIARYQIAHQRLGINASEPGRRAFLGRVIDPLLDRAQLPIHNSANSLNFISGGKRVAMIDFETFSIGPPEFDLAELAIDPVLFAQVGLGRIVALYQFAGGTADRRFTEFVTRAALARSIDFAGAQSQRGLQARSSGDHSAARSHANRARRYRQIASALATDLGISEVVPQP